MKKISSLGALLQTLVKFHFMLPQLTSLYDKSLHTNLINNIIQQFTLNIHITFTRTLLFTKKNNSSVNLPKAQFKFQFK